MESDTVTIPLVELELYPEGCTKKQISKHKCSAQKRELKVLLEHFRENVNYSNDDSKDEMKGLGKLINTHKNTPIICDSPEVNTVDNKQPKVGGTKRKKKKTMHFKKCYRNFTNKKLKRKNRTRKQR